MQYDPNYIRRYYDAYGQKEWRRLESSPSAQVNFHLHQLYLLKYVEKNDLVLEVGPGPGRFTCEMAHLGAKVAVLDISPEQLRLNRERLEEEGLSAAIAGWYEGDVVDLSDFEDNRFDAVVCYGGPLSYVCNQADKALAEMLRVVKPQGFVLLSVMSLLGTTRAFLPGIVEAGYQFGLEKIDAVTRSGELTGDVSRGHRCHMYSWSELQELLHNHECKVVAASASGYLSLQNDETLRLIHSDLKLWETFLEWEEIYCREPGAIDGGTHIIAVVQKA